MHNFFTPIYLRLAVFGALLCAALHVCANPMEDSIRNVLRGKDARVGVAVVCNGRVVARVNDNARYPLMSVFKLHQAMAMADWAQRGNIPMDSAFFVKREDLKTDTYSPLRDKLPNGNFRMSLGEIIQYSIQLSDNNACDILFRYAVSPAQTHQYIRSLGIRNFAIRHNEAAMHEDAARCRDNRTRPSSAARLIAALFTDKRFSGKEFDFLRRTLEECRTGTDRIAAPLQATNAVVAHKTGTGDMNAAGRQTGVNDVAYIRLPNGHNYALAVFIKECGMNMADASALITEVSRCVYQYMLRQKTILHSLP